MLFHSSRVRLFLVAIGCLLITSAPAAMTPIASAKPWLPPAEEDVQVTPVPQPSQAAIVSSKDFASRTIRLWSDYLGFGGFDTLGPPIGKQFEGRGGFYYQAYQRGVLQWRPDQQRAIPANTFDWLNEAGLDEALAAKGIPNAITSDGSHGDWLKARETRLGWLTNPEIKARFLANPNPSVYKTWNVDKSIELYGLPSSRPERFGPFITQRFQRIALQLWVSDVPQMPAKGSVVGILGGELLKEYGIIPADALDNGLGWEGSSPGDDGFDPWVGFLLPVAGVQPAYDMPSRLPGAPRDYRAGIHEGIDFYGVPYDAPVRAVKEGRVIRVDQNYTGISSQQWSIMSEVCVKLGYTPPDMLDIFRGRQVWIEHFHGVVSRYAHLNSIPPDLRLGDWVQAGQVIGGAGSTGTDETVAHAHVELWYAGKYIGQGQSGSQLIATIRRAFGG